MATELRKTGISVVGDIPWGTHFCYFYETKQDLLDILAPYFKVGLENNEFCLWIISNSELLTMQEATSALRKALPDLDRYLADGRIEVVAHDEWFLKGGAFDFRRVTNRFKEKVDEALVRGYVGMRVNGSPAWLYEEGGKGLREFEEEVDKLYSNERIIAACTYPIGESGADFLLDVARNHQFAIARRHGFWDVLETPELMQAKREIKRLNEELEQRVIERTGELAAANEELRREIVERMQVEEQLKQSESQLAEAQRLAHLGSWNWDLQGNALSWSDELYRIFGVEPQTFNPAYEEFVADFVHPEDQAFVRGITESSLKTQKPFSFYNRIFRPDGEERVIHSRGDVVSDEHGNPIRMFGTAQDVTERRRAEEALKESQRRLEEAQRIAHVGHYEHDLDTGVIVMSDENYRILGLQPQESITLSRAFEFVHPDDRERLHRIRNEAVRTGQPFDVEYRFVRPDGEVRFIHSHTDVICDEQGRRTFGVAQDITERKLAEEALRQAEEKYHGIFEHAIEGIFQTTPDGQYITANPALARILGYNSPEELLKHRTDIERQQYVEPERRSEFKRLLEEHSVVQGFEYRAYRKDGSKIWLSDNGRAVRDESGAVLYYEGFTEDITERKLAGEALKKEKEILKKIFDNVPVLIGFIGEDGRVKLVNPEWEHTMGWTLKELQEQDVDIFAEAYPDLSYRQDVLDFVAASTGEWLDLKIKVRDGRVIDAACAIVHLSDGTRVAIAQDITERKRAEEILQTFSQRLIETQEAERRRVARELHDEIGQALTAIKINLQAVQHSAGASPLAPQLNESTGLVDHALQQVRDLSFNLRPSLLDDLGLMAALRWYLDREARRAGLIPEFAADLSEKRLPSELETACFRITQEALTNVVRHAQASRVWVELRQRGAELSLVIRDDGIGFDVSAVRRRRSSDMNLGLQGMQERALILGGRLEIQAAPGGGTEIHAWFPLTLSHPPRRREGDAR
jgi:PAS domain S-box-containing protein